MLDHNIRSRTSVESFDFAINGVRGKILGGLNNENEVNVEWLVHVKHSRQLLVQMYFQHMGQDTV